MASEDIMKELIRTFGLAVPAEELLAKKRAAYRSLIRVPGSLAPFAGVREELVLEILGLAGTFDPVITSSDVPRAKPAPDLYLRAGEGLGMLPSSVP